MVDCDKPEDTIVFTSPMKEIEAAVSSRTGGEITNAIQRLGSVETYQRRYLYMVALDVVESDEMEAMTGMGETAPAAPAPAPKPPVTPEKREEIKKELTDVDGEADPLQLEALKNATKMLRQSGEHDEECMKIAMETHGFTIATKSRCAALIDAIKKMLPAQEEKAE